MKITRIEPPQDEAPAALVEVPEPDPALVETPEARAERQEAESAAIGGTRALVLELQARLEAVEAELIHHRQSADAGFDGEPAELAAHLATTEQHRADAGRLTAKAESLKRQYRVAEQLLGKLEQEQEQAARIQAIGRKLLTAAMERYELAAVALGNAIIELGATCILANQSTSFIAATRALCIPDLLALGHSMPALVGFKKLREGQTVNQSDPEYQRRAELLRLAP